jgi:hypothetical protein
VNTTPRNALEILDEVRKGGATRELSAVIHEAIQAVKMHGKAAKVTIELTIAPMSKGAENLVEAPIVISDEITSKLPKPEPEKTLFYVDTEGNATRKPGERQTGLDFQIGQQPKP